MKNKILRKVFSTFLSVLLVLAMPVQIMAEGEWDLGLGSVDISANESGQTVTQGSRQETNVVPTITGTYTGAGPAITVNTSGGATAELTIQDVNIAPSSGSAIEVGSSNAVINVSGENSVAGNSSGFMAENAAIHVTGSGNLEITSENAGSLEVIKHGSAAGIGTNGFFDDLNEDSCITLSGNVNVNVQREPYTEGAAIGSALWSTMNGTVIIKDDVKFETNSPNAVGNDRTTSDNSDPDVKILDNAEITLTNSNAQIGSWSDSSGSVEIAGTASINGKYGSDAVEFFDAEVVNAEAPVKPETPTPSEPSEPSDDAALVTETPAKANTQREQVYKTVDANGALLKMRTYIQGRTLVIEVTEDYAQFVVIGKNLEVLRSWNIEAVSFTTNGGTSLLSLDGLEGDICLTHDGAGKTLTVGGVEKNDILK